LYYDKSKLPLVVYPETYLPDTKTAQQLNAMNANYQRVWFIPAAPDYWDPDGFVEKWLDHRADLSNEWEVDDLNLRLYGTASQYLNTMAKSGANFENVATLLGYRSEKVGNQIRIVLYWRAQHNLKEWYTVKLVTQDSNWRELAANTETPVHGAYPTNEWRKNQIIVDQHDMPWHPEIAAVEIKVINARTGVPVQVIDPLTQRHEWQISVPLR
jgi:hypothetical protein